MSTDLYHDLNTAQVMPSEDWTYTMRRTMQEIVPGVFLGLLIGLDHLDLHKMVF